MRGLDKTYFLGYSVFMKTYAWSEEKNQLLKAGQDLLDSYERDEWQSVGMLSEKLKQYQAYAISAFEADGLVNVVLSEDDLKAIQQKATDAGISYQTLIANIVHEFVSGNLIEKS